MFLSAADPDHAFHEVTLAADTGETARTAEGEVTRGATGHPMLPARADGLDGPELLRTARMPRFIAAEVDPAEVLRHLKVAVVGAGAVGRSVVLHLARLMIARIWVVDSGTFKRESLITQAIFPNDVGQPKASNAGRLAKQISPRTRVDAFDGAVEALGVAALADADLIVLATDNLLAEVTVGQACIHLGTPLIHAAVHGDSLTAQVRFFTNGEAERACPACGFNDAERAHLNAHTKFPCDPTGSGGRTPIVDSAPTMSVSFLCSAAADLGLMQLLRHVLGLGVPVDDTLLEYYGYTHRTSISPLHHNARCPADHTPWQRAAPPRTLASCSPRALAREVGLADVVADVGFAIDATSYVEWAVCSERHRQRIDRFVSPGAFAGRCRRCAAPLRPQPFYSHRPATGAMLGPRVARRLDRIADRRPRAALARYDERAFFFRDGSHEHRLGAEGVMP